MTDGLEAALRAADTVVFDFDGVLTDSEPLHLRSYRELMAGEGGGIDEDTFRALIGRKEREIWPTVAGPECDVDSLVARRSQLMLDLTEREGLRLDPRAARMLEWSGGERVLLSSGSPVLVDGLLRRWDAAGLFGEVHALGDSRAVKPDELRRIVADRRTRSSWSGVLVEDSPQMLNLGSEIGLVTVGVVHTLNTAADVAAADFVVERAP
ncbi:MAG TPA: HAD family hydrolase [Gaiellales bacterium]|nr:HAD family hydrolase [Gaiellales bacterium]